MNDYTGYAGKPNFATPLEVTMADYTQRKICVYPRGQPLHNYTPQELERIRHFNECLIAGAKNEIMMRKLQPYPALETPSTQSPPLPQMTKPRPVQGGEVKKMPYKGLLA